MDQFTTDASSRTYRWTIFLLPICTVAMSVLACGMSYGIGLRSGTIEPLPFMPFISDMGDSPPQSSVFTLGLTISCYFTLLVVIIRYNQVKCIYYNGWKPNDVAIYFGVTFILGKLIIASFQLSSNKQVHYIGAGLYFIGTTGYVMLQVYITRENITRTWVAIYYTRCVCAVGMVISAILFAVFFGVPSLKIYNRYGANVAQAAEWTFAVLKMTFMLSFLHDFWNVDVSFYIKFKERKRRNDLSLEIRGEGY